MAKAKMEIKTPSVKKKPYKPSKKEHMQEAARDRKLEKQPVDYRR
jgi:hypothetical protein